MRALDLAGKRFGRLTVLHEGPRPDSRHRVWLCRCDCGTEKLIRQDHLGTRILACGCLQRERASEANGTHRLSDTPEFATWMRIKNRCLNQNSPDYPDYGGRGIAVCAEWLDNFPAFLRDLGPRPSLEHSIDRIDNDGPYAAWNCRWATPLQQASNRRQRGYNRWNPKPITV